MVDTVMGLVEIFCPGLVGYYQFWCVCSIPDHQYRCTRFQVELVHVLVILPGTMIFGVE